MREIFRKGAAKNPRFQNPLSLSFFGSRLFSDSVKSRKKIGIECYRDHFDLQIDDTQAFAELSVFSNFNNHLAKLRPSLESLDCWITHGWDDKSGGQNTFVKNVSINLEVCGHRVFSDQNPAATPQIEKFMEEFGIIEPKKIILVLCTPLYIERLNEKNSKPNGVQKEFKGVRKWLEGSKAIADRVIPILLEGTQQTAIPIELHNHLYISFDKEIEKEKKRIPNDHFSQMLELIKRMQAHYSRKNEEDINAAIEDHRRISQELLSKAIPQGSTVPRRHFFTSLPLDDGFNSKIKRAVNTRVSIPHRIPQQTELTEYPGLMPKYKYFRGRRKDLETIEKIIREENICFIKDNPRGKGGKTFLANTFAYEQLQNSFFECAYWINGSSTDTVENDILNILKTPQPAETDFYQDFLDGLRSELDLKTKKVLLVYDDVCDLESLKSRGIFDKNEGIFNLVIIDKIKRVSAPENQIHEIFHDTTWVKEYLTSRFPEIKQNEVLENNLIVYSEEFPLIIYQIVSFIGHVIDENKKIDVQKFIENVYTSLTEKKAKIREIEEAAGSKRNDLTRLALSYLLFFLEYQKKLSKGEKNQRQLDHRLLYQILNFCSLIGHERISRKLITNWLGQRDGETNKILDLLIEVKLLDVDRTDNKNFFVMYEPVQKAVLFNLTRVSFNHLYHLYYVENWLNIAMRVLLGNIGKIESVEILQHIKMLVSKISNPAEYELPYVRESYIDRYNLASMHYHLAEHHANNNSHHEKTKHHIENSTKLAVEMCSNVHKFWNDRKQKSTTALHIIDYPVCPRKQ